MCLLVMRLPPQKCCPLEVSRETAQGQSWELTPPTIRLTMRFPHVSGRVTGAGVVVVLDSPKTSSLQNHQNRLYELNENCEFANPRLKNIIQIINIFSIFLTFRYFTFNRL
ncbi:unnamed protein product [Meganyctiphanes norvegica]|uniref:Uncharacterized protein n=1 Tax=Meganyctiphanes norvegica TaxID=48144 RepID=A0AAV2PVZ8_MEGNR